MLPQVSTVTSAGYYHYCYSAGTPGGNCNSQTPILIAALSQQNISFTMTTTTQGGVFFVDDVTLLEAPLPNPACMIVVASDGTIDTIEYVSKQ